MKLHANKSNIERGGVKTESAFTIKTNALSFRILSSGLYTDTQRAIVRELSCNAYDAHVDGNNTSTPFEIHLPNQLEPFLSIKDFGTGLSDEDIQGVKTETIDEDGETLIQYSGGLYTTYFESTKTQSNDFIGALGLGSKSPFSYTTAFEVVSRFEGIRRTYAIFLNEGGIPTVALMNEIPTDEHSGLEVKLTIEKEDFYNFKRLTSEVLQYFPVKPIVTGAENFTFTEISESALQGDDWLLSPSGYGNRKIIAVQGNVPYRVNMDIIENDLSEVQLKIIRQAEIIMFFDIGELEVSANREEIHYDKASVLALVTKIQKVSKELTHEIESQVQSQHTNYWDVSIELQKMSNNLFKQSNVITMLDTDHITDENLKRYVKYNGYAPFTNPHGLRIVQYTTSSNRSLKRKQPWDTILPTHNSIVIINDVKIGGVARTRTFLNDYNYDSAVLISEIKPMIFREEDGTAIPYIGHDVERKRLLNEIGQPETVFLSDISDAVKKTSAPRQKNTRLPIYKFGGIKYTRSSYLCKIDWAYKDYDMSQGGLYIPLKFASQPYYEQGTKTVGMDFHDGDDNKRMLSFLIEAYNKKYKTTYTIYDLFGLPSIAYKKAKKIDKWVNLFEFGEKIIPKYAEQLEFRNDLDATEDDYKITEVLTNSSFTNRVSRLSPTSEFKTVVYPIIKKLRKAPSELNINTVERLFQQYFGDTKTIRSGVPLYTTSAFKKYKMFEIIKSFPKLDEWKILFNYINLIDKENN